MDDLRVEDEPADSQKDAAPPPRQDSGRAGAVLASLVPVVALLVCVVLVGEGEATFAFRGMDASAYQRNAILVMCIAVGVPLAAIVWWVIRHRHFTRTGRRHRWGPLVTACVCLVLGLTSIVIVSAAARRVEHAAVVSFQESLDATAVEDEAVAHLEWMARSLELEVLGEPEVTRESCVLADRSRGVAPIVVLRAETGRVPAEDLARVAMVFWRGDGYDPSVDIEHRMAYVSGVHLRDPYEEILVVSDLPTGGVHELSYHAVCMTPPVVE